MAGTHRGFQLALVLLTAALALPAHGGEAPSLRAVAIVTGQFEGMVAFYRDVVGLELSSAENGYAQFRDSPLVIVEAEVMREASGQTAFVEPAAGQRFELAFELPTADAVDDFYAALEAGGAHTVVAPHDTAWGQRVAYFADPDGNVHDVFAPLEPR